MSQRLSAFDNLAADPWYGRLFKSLTESDLQLCRNFIIEHAPQPHAEFSRLAQEWELAIPKDLRPKKIGLMTELVLVCSKIANKNYDCLACLDVEEPFEGPLCRSCIEAGFWMDPAGTLHSPGSNPLDSYR